MESDFRLTPHQPFTPASIPHQCRGLHECIACFMKKWVQNMDGSLEQRWQREYWQQQSNKVEARVHLYGQHRFQEQSPKALEWHSSLPSLSGSLEFGRLF